MFDRSLDFTFLKSPLHGCFVFGVRASGSFLSPSFCCGPRISVESGRILKHMGTSVNVAPSLPMVSASFVAALVLSLDIFIGNLGRAEIQRR